MSTLEEFESAPAGATATSPDGSIAFKTARCKSAWSMYDSHGRDCGNHRSDEMGGFTLNPAAPTTAREALDLAWELAHPVKYGQVVPKGTACLARFDDGYQHYETPGELVTTDIRTLDPLPEPEPDWLDTEARTRLPEALAALQAVLDMHHDTGDGWCNECSDGFLTRHPCPTVRAIQDAIGEPQ